MNAWRESWAHIDDLEAQSAVREGERVPRDVSIRPWTGEASAMTHELVQYLTGQLARVELRQKILFGALISIRETLTMFAIIGGCAAVISVATGLF